MTNHGDDCYFFYYSTCTKGDSCPFRHCEAAMGNETVCNLWQEGRCFRTICKFRHMEITKNRREIPCYWENQPAGCQKYHCAFQHEKARYIDGVYFPPDRGLNKNEEQPLEEPAPAPAAPLPTAANPQLRGVIKTETQEPVPSPTHPPVVINPADDDEDEDDQFSEEGDASPRKLSKLDGSLNFGVSTLEEIRLRKALKASMRRAGYPVQSGVASASGEKENIQSFFRPATYEAGEGSLVFEETGRPRGSVAQRLGRKIPVTDVKSGEGGVLKRSLAARLGSVVDEEEEPPHKALKPVRERLGLPAAHVAPTNPAESEVETHNEPEQIRIKTLEEIRQEKAAKSQSWSPSRPEPENTKSIATKATRGAKRAITIRDESVGHVKTFSEILRAKKKRQEEEEEEEEQQEPKHSPKRAKQAGEKTPDRNQAEANTAGPGPEATKAAEVRVKTLEEIRREKAARLQARQVAEPESKKSCDAEENGAKKPRLLRVNKPAPQSNVTTDKEKKTQAASPKTVPAASYNVKVKSFEEIMREKRLRKQEMEEQDKTSAEGEPPQKSPPKTNAPDNDSLTSSGSSSPSSTTQNPDTTPSSSSLRLPLRKLVKSKAASPTNNTAPARTTTAAVKAASSVRQSSSARGGESENGSQSPSSSREASDKTPRNSALSPAKQSRETPAAERTLNNQKKSPEHTADTKVRPKLNVKPSVMKPAVQMKPGQKRRGAERSAVAAVKPLNSASTELEEPLQERMCGDGQAFPSSSAEAQLSSAVPHSPSSLLDSGTSSSPVGEELQTVPVFKQSVSLSQEPSPSVTAATAREACAVPQSPVLKSPTSLKTRRQSTGVPRTTSTSSAAASTSAVDDFEELMNEFTDDHLEEDVDPGIGEDDLLQELSEMIDS